MSFCELCSRPVNPQSLDPKRCFDCSRNAPLPAQACTVCGVQYPRLQGDTCFACSEGTSRAEVEYQNGLNATLRYHMEQPASAVQLGQNRHRRPKGNGINAAAYAGSDPAYRARAEAMVSGLTQGYGAALLQNEASGNPQRPVQRPKVFQSPVPIPAMKSMRISVQIERMKCGKTVLDALAFEKQFYGSDRWGDVENKMKAMAIESVREFGVNAVSTDLRFGVGSRGKLLLDGEHSLPDMSLQQVFNWHQANGSSYITKNQVTRTLFALTANFNLPPPPKNFNADVRAPLLWSRYPLTSELKGTSRAYTTVTTTAATRSAATKRQRSDDNNNDSERFLETRPRKRAYATIAPPQREHVTVTESRLALTTGSENRQITQLPDETGIAVSIDKEPSCRGASKEVYKLYRGQSGEVWAAKRFFAIGPANAFGIVNATSSEDELRTEMMRQVIVQDLLLDFLAAAGSAVKLPIPEIRVAVPTVMRVESAAMGGSVYLVDRWLAGDFTKFSTNVEAGDSGLNDNISFHSLCDALPHWTMDSAGLVVVDIQGIFTLELGRQGMQKKVLTLFDLMIHSEEEAYGLGDEGQKGIDRFKSQHRCNRVCRLLGLDDGSSVDN
ncbi:kinase-like protein [Exidia glandulosa HHB12029]|uniref:Kinase-like protein n=1 Tax=Exidia glandulosa HHB12029 TaxID=1314781 RepID=A0A165J6D7_EXIGL|nr:kinase-like protein [Exidia glandulosa HHB12029]